jgi:hypothetical protein
MKYKVGDKVRVKSLEWYNKNKNNLETVKCSFDLHFIPEMVELCGCIVTIKAIYSRTYKIKESEYSWTDDMFEGLVEDTIQPVVFENIVFPNENYADKVELCLGNDYEIVVEDGRTFVQKKKPKYPKSFQECYYLLYGQQDLTFGCDIMKGAYGNLLECLQMLLICREVYWKIAGIEIGLDKSWEPDWTESKPKYTIVVIENKLVKHYALTQNYILAFPTAEMRDEFYKNFKDLIENCKELL